MLPRHPCLCFKILYSQTASDSSSKSDVIGIIYEVKNERGVIMFSESKQQDVAAA